jgi:hypothetical protein
MPSRHGPRSSRSQLKKLRIKIGVKPETTDFGQRAAAYAKHTQDVNRKRAKSLGAAPGKPLELPPGIARSFVADMHAFFAEPNATKRDEIAARQLHALREHQGPRDKKLRLTDVHEMFLAMKDQVRARSTASEGGRVKSSNRLPR